MSTDAKQQEKGTESGKIDTSVHVLLLELCSLHVSIYQSSFFKYFEKCFLYKIATGCLFQLLSWYEKFAFNVRLSSMPD